MTEKRFTRDNTGCVIDNTRIVKAINVEQVVELLNEQHEELMNLRLENTKMKLIVSDVVDDLNKQAESKEPIVINKEYVKWIKKEIDLRLDSQKGDSE